MTFKFRQINRNFEPLEMFDVVYQSLGAASMAWEKPEDAGEFDADYAYIIGRELLTYISDYIESGGSSFTLPGYNGEPQT